MTVAEAEGQTSDQLTKEHHDLDLRILCGFDTTGHCLCVVPDIDHRHNRHAGLSRRFGVWPWGQRRGSKFLEPPEKGNVRIAFVF